MILIGQEAEILNVTMMLMAMVAMVILTLASKLVQWAAHGSGQRQAPVAGEVTTVLRDPSYTPASGVTVRRLR